MLWVLAAWFAVNSSNVNFLNEKMNLCSSWLEYQLLLIVNLEAAKGKIILDRWKCKFVAENRDYEHCCGGNNWCKKDCYLCEFYYSEALQALCTFCLRGRAQLMGHYTPLPTLGIPGHMCECSLLLLGLWRRLMVLNLPILLLLADNVYGGVVELGVFLCWHENIAGQLT